MPGYWQLLAIVTPVFVLFALGALLRSVCRLTAEAEAGMLRLYVNCFYPALILKSVLGNAALRDPANIAWPPLAGFGTILLGFAVGYYAGRALGLHVGSGLRTFAFTVGIYNYGFIPIPLMESLYGREPLGVLLVQNMGCELAIWSVGLLVLSGLSPREGWRQVLNPPLCTLVVALGINAGGIALPAVVMRVVELLGGCAIPFGLLLCGVTLETYLAKPGQLFHGRTTPVACLLRLAVLPVAFLLLAKFAPVSLELKRVLAVQAAMPSGMMPLVLARHYGGQPLTAAQIIVGTTLLGILVIPLWLYVGLGWVGG
ncbi:MAG TPA: AEC family transporter [Opitutaceae bacterium]|nr:AEC family transporter [Opitutaceae bacterium]